MVVVLFGDLIAVGVYVPVFLVSSFKSSVVSQTNKKWGANGGTTVNILKMLHQAKIKQPSHSV